MKKISRHVQDPEQAKENRIENYLEILLSDKKEKLNYTRLSSSLLACAGSYHFLQVRQPTVVRAIEWAAEAKTAHLRVAHSKKDTESVTVAGRTRLHSTGYSPADAGVDVTEWIFAFDLAAICRRDDLQNLLVEIPTNKLRRPGVEVNEFVFTYADALKALYRGDGDELSNLLVKAVDQSDKSANLIAPRWVDSIGSPSLQLLYGVCAGQEEFDEALELMLRRHKKYFAIKQYQYYFPSQLCFPALARAAYAFDRGRQINVASDYLPPYLVHGAALYIRTIESRESRHVDALRSRVTPEDLPFFVELYEEYDDWQLKRYVIDLVQDQHDPMLQPIMRDVLSAPEPIDKWEEWIRAVAICHVKNEPSFEKYYNDSEAAKLAADQLKGID